MLTRALLLVAGGLLAAVTIPGPAAAADVCHPTPPVCDPHGNCTAGVTCPGGGGSHSHGPGGSGPAAPGKCYTQNPRTEVACHNSFGWWNPQAQCWFQLEKPQPPQSDPVWEGNTTGAIYVFSCLPMAHASIGGVVWLASPPPGFGGVTVTPGELAVRALASLHAPRPSTGRYPAGVLADGRPYTVVHAWTWFWTDPASFRPLTARAAEGGVWAQVTVTPAALTFTPGDGSAAVSCPGPGVAWLQGDGVWAASPAGCNFAYRHSSIHVPGQQVTAVYGIDWQVSWTGSGGATGTLPGFTTSAASTFAVAEVESLVVR